MWVLLQLAFIFCGAQISAARYRARMRFPIFCLLVAFLLELPDAKCGILEDAFGLKIKKEDSALSTFRRCLLLNGLRARKLLNRDLDDKLYKQVNEQWNLRQKTVYPRAYYLPTTAADVAAAVKCGRKAGIRLIPNSGGHSYEGLGWGSNETIAVDFRKMKKMSVEGEGANAIGVLEPGNNVGGINTFLWENGGYAVPMGNCLTVGIGGHAIGGGIGYYTSYYGLSTDNIVEVELVNAEGGIVVANKNKNANLFWALQGSGPGYLGIVTKVKVKLFEASKIKMTLVRIRYSLKDFAAGWIAVQNFQNWIIKNEPKIMIGVVIVSDTYNNTLPPAVPGMLVSLLHIEDPRQHPKSNEDFSKAFREHFPAPAVLLYALNPSYIQFVAMTGYAPVVLPHPLTGQPVEVGIINKFLGMAPSAIPTEKQSLDFFKLMKKEDAAKRYFKAKSFFINKVGTLEEMEKVQEVILRMPQNNFWILVNTEQGAVGEIPRNATAYVHRDSLLGITVQYEGSADPKFVVPGMNYLYELYNAFKFLDRGETYQNYPDLDEKDHLDRNYKENLPRLVEAKAKWDPKNYFVSAFSLPLTLKQEL